MAGFSWTMFSEINNSPQSQLIELQCKYMFINTNIRQVWGAGSIMVTIISKYSEHMRLLRPDRVKCWDRPGWLLADIMSAMTRGQTKEKMTIKIRLKREY